MQLEQFLQYVFARTPNGEVARNTHVYINGQRIDISMLEWVQGENGEPNKLIIKV